MHIWVTTLLRKMERLYFHTIRRIDLFLSTDFKDLLVRFIKDVLVRMTVSMS